MIAYLILVHRFPEQFKRMFRAIYDSNNYYLIHVDKRSGIELQTDLQSFLATYPNTQIMKSKDARWGGYSLVDAELRGIKQLLKMGIDWDFFINLSAQDFPLKSQKDIQGFLKLHIGQDFLKVLNQTKIRPETLNRIQKFVIESGNKVTQTSRKRVFMKNVVPYIGHQWMILSRKFCQFVVYSRETKKFKDFYKNTFIADEAFFQTVIMNTSYEASIVNDDKRAIDWVPDGTIKLRPRNFTIKDAKFLLKSSNLFARKFDETVDSQILGVLEDSIAKKSGVDSLNLIGNLRVAATATV